MAGAARDTPDSCESTALYRIFGLADLLYIGVSKDFGRRWQEHAQKQPWWNERRRMTVDVYDTRDEALDAEAVAIFSEQPRHNVLHRKQAQRLRRLRQQMRAEAPERLETCQGTSWADYQPEEYPYYPPPWAILMPAEPDLIGM